MMVSSYDQTYNINISIIFSDPCAKYISVVSDYNKKKFIQSSDYKDALKIIELSENPVPHPRYRSVPREILNSSSNKGADDGLLQRKHQETQTDDGFMERNDEISSEVQNIINLFKNLKSNQQKKSVLDAINPIPQAINQKTQSAIDPDNYQDLDKNDYITQLSLIIKDIHESSIKNGPK